MKLSAILLLLIAGCTTADDPSYTVETPSGTGAGGSTGGSTSTRIAGRVCVLADPTLMSACAITGAGGLTVTAAGASTTTSQNGTFSLAADSVSPTTNLAVTGTGIVPSQVSVANASIVPVMNQQLFASMVLATRITTEPQTGMIIASVVNGQGVPAAGVTATSLPVGTVGPFFDGTGATPFTLDATGARGVVMFPNVPTTGATRLSFTNSAETETTVDGIQVVDGGITFVDATLR